MKKPTPAVVASVIILILAGLTYWITRSSTPATIKLDFPETITPGEEVRIPLLISSTVALNAGEFYFSFPKELLEVKTIDQGGSFFQLWITGSPQFSNEKGAIELAGGLPKPGFKGKDGLVATVVFKAKGKGEGTIILDETRSRILANDGLGTKIGARWRPIDFRVR